VLACQTAVEQPLLLQLTRGVASQLLLLLLLNPHAPQLKQHGAGLAACVCFAVAAAAAAGCCVAAAYAALLWATSCLILQSLLCQS
jgi:hypothetical protein